MALDHVKTAAPNWRVDLGTGAANGNAGGPSGLSSSLDALDPQTYSAAPAEIGGEVNRMVQSKIGPNDPCPCGSGKKYKRCCRGEASNAASSTECAPAAPLTRGQFRFEPGSYGGNGMFAASISCQKQVRPGEWVYHFVLANPALGFEAEHEAVAAARKHLAEASSEKARTGSDAAFARYLSSLGYLKVDGFKVIEEHNEEQ